MRPAWSKWHIEDTARMAGAGGRNLLSGSLILGQAREDHNVHKGYGCSNAEEKADMRDILKENATVFHKSVD